MLRPSSYTTLVRRARRCSKPESAFTAILCNGWFPTNEHARQWRVPEPMELKASGREVPKLVSMFSPPQDDPMHTKPAQWRGWPSSALRCSRSQARCVRVSTAESTPPAAAARTHCV